MQQRARFRLLSRSLLIGALLPGAAFLSSCKHEQAESPRSQVAEGPALSGVDVQPLARDPAATPEPTAVADRADFASRAWNFEQDHPDRVAAGLVAAVGQWEVTTDEGTPNGAQVLAQLATSEDDVFNVALMEDTSYLDADISVRLRPVSGRVDQGGGIVWRASGASNYYVARYNPLEDNFRVYKVVDGRRRMLESATVRIDHAAWHAQRVVMRGDHIECYLDGTKFLDVRDSTFADAGQIGLWTKADAKTHFDDLTVAAAPASGGER